jgi:predicted N-acyltransferase
MEWAFLEACEAHSALPQYGVAPQHLTLWDDERLVAALPLYVKGDGRAEFIYDYHWYHLASRLGVEYYPKLVSMSPFTPVPGPHVLVAPDQDKSALIPTLAAVVERFAEEAELRGVHYLFLPDDEADALEGLGYVRRVTFQLVWTNDGYVDLDDFLSRFRSRDRVKFKRERRRLEEAGLRLERVTGDAIQPEHEEAIYRFYSRTCELYGTGSHYLQRGTWKRLFEAWRDRLHLFFAREEQPGGELVGGSLCVQKGEDLYGRYWGCREEVPALYFNMALYRPLELAIERGWRRFFAGSGNVAHKYSRGFQPWRTLSLHRLASPELQRALGRHLQQDRAETEAEIARLTASARLTRKEG